MVGERKAAVERPPAAGAAHQHPPRGESCGLRPEAAGPHRAVGGGRGDDDRPGPVGAAVHRAGVRRGRQRHAGGAVHRRHPLHGSVGEDGANRGVKSREEPLRLAQRIAVEEGGLAGGLVGAPPVVDLAEDVPLGRPPVDGEAEGGLGDEGVAADRLVRGRGGIGIGLVVARDDPDLAAVLEADLGGAEDVSGGMQRDADAADGGRGTVGQPGDVRLGRQAAPQHAHALGGGEIGAAAPRHVVAVGVGHHGPVHRAPRIHVEVAGLAVEAALGESEERHPARRGRLSCARSLRRPAARRSCRWGRSSRRPGRHE